jgi:glycosyltransferase involved in cell wall biosynthesis
MIAYNQEKYVAEAMQGALMQETTFPFELVIGEDCSSDRTREIVRDWERRYPARIRLVLSDQNRGAWENFRQTLLACRGEYVALLDGDDYWTDPRKLQIQVDFLDAHPDYALCFHNARKVYEGGQRPSVLCFPADQQRVVTLADILARNFIPTCSVMVRNGLIDDLPAWSRTLSVGDWPFHVLNALHGRIGYLENVMGTFRIHDAGLWSGKDRIQRLTSRIAVYRAFLSNLDSRYADPIQSALALCYLELSSEHEQEGNLRSARRYAVKALLATRFRKGGEGRKILARGLRLYAPGLWRLARRSR